MEAKNGNDGFADAVAKANMIAAKLNSQILGGDGNVGVKRPFDGGSDLQPDAKKMATYSDHLDGSSKVMTDQQRALQAAQAAAAAASQINAKLGIQSAGQTSSADAGDLFGVPGMGPQTSETLYVPDRMVGLLIGKGGEQIAAIQSETECRIQFAPDSGGQPERHCTLTGTAAAIVKAKEAIARVINKTQGIPSSSQEGLVELMVPGSKVGLIIGKGGEMIRQLQDRANVKIVVIQDSNAPTSHDKPVRITGDKESCQRARDMILDMLAEKDLQTGFIRGGPGGKGNSEVPVPRALIKLILGKGGEVARRIQEETGTRVHFKYDDNGGPTRVCSITGSEEGRSRAVAMIQDIVGEGGPRQNDGGKSYGAYGGNWDSGRDHHGNTNQFQGGSTYPIPADKCGLVIGKGGETIREINRISGARVELVREPSHNPHEKLFRIQGSPSQTDTAIRLIREKAGLASAHDQGFHGPPSHPGGMGGPPMGGPPMGGSPYGPPNPQGGPPRQPMIPPQQPPQSMGPYGMQPGQPPQGMAPQPSNYGQQWPGSMPGYQQPYYNQPAQPDPNKPGADPNAAAWAAYYSQYYNQGGTQPVQTPVQQPQQQQQQPQPQQPAPYSAPSAVSAASPAAQPQPSVNPQTGQPDYSLAWAEYYRQQGMHQHAAAILQASQQSSHQQQ